MPSGEQVDRSWLRCALVKGCDLSKDSARKLGCVLVHAGGKMVSMGYNGMPANMEETPEMWERPLKYEYVVHAEINAIVNAPFDTNNSTIYGPIRPCHRCLGPIVNAGVIRMVWFREDIPFAGNNEEIFWDIVHKTGIKYKEYEVDLISQQLMDIYWFKHQGYGEVEGV